MVPWETVLTKPVMAKLPSKNVLTKPVKVSLVLMRLIDKTSLSEASPSLLFLYLLIYYIPHLIYYILIITHVILLLYIVISFHILL